jgi:hypothetical protein
MGHLLFGCLLHLIDGSFDRGEEVRPVVEAGLPLRATLSK